MLFANDFHLYRFRCVNWYYFSHEIPDKFNVYKEYHVIYAERFSNCQELGNGAFVTHLASSPDDTVRHRETFTILVHVTFWHQAITQADGKFS